MLQVMRHVIYYASFQKNLENHNLTLNACVKYAILQIFPKILNKKWVHKFMLKKYPPFLHYN